MRILSMIATFGKLDGDILRLEPGLNVIHAPNEWGKSTWCAFLAAMLYGVETRERNTKGAMADKERYAPWSGKAMEGLLRIEYKGRDITIQRRAKGRVPLGEFQAFETQTGLAVPELTVENCGRVLLGVEKSVFLRTGFIRFADLAVIPDEALWQRLHALVTTGDESGSAALLTKKLKELKNKIRSSRGGLIPETERKLQNLESQLRERESLEQQCLRLSSQGEDIQRELEDLERHSRVCAYREAKENRAQTEAAKQAALDARAACEELEEQCGSIPVRSELTAKLRKAQDLMEELQMYPSAEPPAGTWIWIWLLTAALAVLTGVVCLLNRLWIGVATAAVGAVLSGILAGKTADRRRSTLLRQKADQLKREKRINDLTEAIGTMRRQLALREELESARRTAEQTRIRLQSLVSMAKQASEEEVEDELTLTREETEERMVFLTQQYKQNRLRLGQCQGRMETMPELENLKSGMEACRSRLKALEEYEQAIALAQRKGEEASRSLQRRFAPRITALTREYLSVLTADRYTRVSIGEDLSILAATEAETTLRASAWRSDGTADVMYLAMRLAVWVLLNPNGPLVLDDALIRLDDGRLGCAMKLLRQLGEERQIILFTCQNREKQWLE